MMKKISLLLFALITAFNLNSQSLSPYMPEPYVSTTSNPDETQMTFFDFDFVRTKVTHFAQQQLSLIQKSPVRNVNQGKGTITQKFLASTAGKGELSFTYTVEAVEDSYLITGLRISGSASLISDFYAKYWTRNQEAKNTDKTTELTFLQDKITYNKSASPYLEISNTEIADAQSFLALMRAKEAAWKEESNQEIAGIAEEQQSEQDKIAASRETEAARLRAKAEEEAAERKNALEQSRTRDAARQKKSAEAKQQMAERQAKLQAERTEASRQQQEKSLSTAKEIKLRQAKADTLRNTVSKKLLFDVVKSNTALKTDLKKGTGSLENLEIVNSLKERLNEFMADKNEGVYIISADYKRVYQEIKTFNFKVRKFTKPTTAQPNKQKKTGSDD